MSSISFKLDAFEGPLDLLLHLISKHKLNINDIEISLLLDQYMEYMNQLETEDYEEAADFLEMAARLIYIKTCALLPQQEEAEELKKELEGRIIEYSLCKKTAEKLRELYAGGEIFVRPPVKLPINKTYCGVHEVQVLYDAYMGISPKVKDYKPLRANMFSPIVSHRIVSVTSKIIFVLKKLYKTGKCEISMLYEGITDKSEKVATFLAVLELTKSGRIFINDDNTEIEFRRGERKHSHGRQAENADVEETLQHEEIPQSSQQNEPDNTQQDSFEDNNLSVEEFSDYEEEQALPQRDREKAPETSRYSVKFSSEVIERKHTVSMPIGEIKAVVASVTIPAVEVEEKEESVESENAPRLTQISEQYDNRENTADEPDKRVKACENEAVEVVWEEFPPTTVIKPSYWSLSRYFWGFSPVGDDSKGNYWQFGNRRFSR